MASKEVSKPADDKTVAGVTIRKEEPVTVIQSFAEIRNVRTNVFRLGDDEYRRIAGVGGFKKVEK